MGIHNLLLYVKPTLQPCNIKEFKGYVAAIDMSGWIISAICSTPQMTSAMTYVKNKLETVINAGVIPFAVFDGSVPSIKNNEINKRITKNKLSGPDARRKRRQFARDVIAYLREKGICYIVSPYEADIQIALLMKQGHAKIAITEDADFIVNECELILFKMNWDGDGDLYQKSEFLSWLGIQDREQAMQFVRWVCLVAGGDYFKTPRVGPTTAWKLFDQEYTDDIAEFKIRVRKLLKRKVQDWPEYFNGFYNANDAFKYQLAFDINKKKLVPLNAYPPGVNHLDYPLAGEMLTDELAIKFAIGDVEFGTMLVDNMISSRPLPPFKAITGKEDLMCINFEQLNSKIPLERIEVNAKNKNVFKCYQCDINFETFTKFNRHLNNATKHPEQVNFLPKVKCGYCSNVYQTTWTFLYHQKYHCTKREGVIKLAFKCDDCKRVFKSKYSLIQHQSLRCPILRPNYSQLRFRCDTCQEKFNTKEQQEAHITLCGVAVEKDDVEREIEILAIDIEKPKQQLPSNRIKVKDYLKCKVCGYEAVSPSSLKLHEKIHDKNRKKTVICTECGATFWWQTELSKHLRLSHNKKVVVKPVNKPVKCSNCNKSYSNRDCMLRHFKTTHVDCPKKFQCHICMKIYKRSDYLKFHVRRHEQIQNCLCQYCNRTFTSKGRLQIHQHKSCAKKPISKEKGKEVKKPPKNTTQMENNSKIENEDIPLV